MLNLATDEYFYGVGESAFQLLDATDKPIDQLLFVGNADAVKVSMQVERKEKRESKTGLNLLVRSKVTQLGGEIEISINEKHKSNLELFLFGTGITRAAQVTFTDENKLTVAQTGASQIGNIYRLQYQKVSNVVITDDGAGNAVISSTKYEVDANYGKIKVVLNFAGTGPYTVKYDAAAVPLVQVFQHSGKSFLYRHEGIDIGNNVDLPYLFEAYKVRLNPVQDLDLITDDFGKFVLKGTLLSSLWHPTDPNFGRFGRHVDLR